MNNLDDDIVMLFVVGFLGHLGDFFGLVLRFWKNIRIVRLV